MTRENFTHLKSKVEDKEFTIYSKSFKYEPMFIFELRHLVKVKNFKRKYKKSLTKNNK